MFTERPASRPGEPDEPFRFVCYPGRNRWLRGHILCPRPRQFTVHFSPILGKTLPCLQVRCFGCSGTQPLVLREYVFLPFQAERPKQLMVVGIQAKFTRPLWDHPEVGDYWRGVTIEAGRGDSKWDECTVKVLGRVPDDYPLPDAWDVSRDLAHVWSSWIPRQWDGTIRDGIQPPAEPGEDIPT
jgi:hypothetical protein